MDHPRAVRSYSEPRMPDASPLLGSSSSSSAPGVPRSATSGRSHSRRRTIEAANYIRRASSSRLMREQSLQVREAAAEQLEERQSDWAYSRPVVVLDLVWNLAFAVVAVVILVLSRHEQPVTPLRLWVCGYAVQCVLHMVCVWFEYRRRRRRQLLRGSSRGGAGGVEDASVGVAGQNNVSGRSPSDSDTSSESEGTDEDEGAEDMSFAKRLESANTMFSFVWWIVGFYWVTSGGQSLAQNAPQLYWLCVIFLAFDVFFVVFCVALACVIGIAVCCCLPCIIAILYAVADQEGASEEDIRALATFKFRKLGEAGEPGSGGIMSASGLDGPERSVTQENAECCICLSSYEDGVELRELPCTHHFHSSCIDKWLRINATCPLCKYNIVRGAAATATPEEV